ARTIDPSGAVIGDFPVQAGDRVRGRLIAENIVVNSSAMFRREVFDRVGGYDPRYAMGEDYHLWLRMAHHGEVTVLDQVLVDYRIHRQQAMRRVSQLGPHVPEVLRQQRSLARLIGAPRMRSAVQSTRWLAIQVAMAGRVVIGNLALRLRPAPQ
ncbi:MAG TPA: hypothetical protein VFM95_05630, partial [Microcella sp.]|nr:hypothetical protein [Microcella sp.]